ncbi:DUF3080 family protein [Halioglobus maricola]|uniref:DUF3080 family protein n=2 Tax=Halioglobus maricola TaxID=2601894 RepID=A0A5P9NR21_9GAMM|nr:DUF3080 family protein [Halioglobus maricola]
MLAACDASDHNQPFATYLARLERTLDRPATQPHLAVSTPRRPRTGQLRIAVPADDLDVLDFMDLRGCTLQETIGKRNSVLGRHARDSQRLLLELEFLRRAPACIEMLRRDGDNALAEQLTRNMATKHEQLPARIFNATLGNDEYARFWRPATLSRQYPDSTSSAPVAALASVNALASRWLAGDYAADNREFELLLYDLSIGDGGTLWLALDQQAAWLDAANSVLATYAANGPMCRGQIRPEAADILPAVVKRFFIQDIQPRAAKLGQRYHQLLPPVQALETLLEDALPDNYRSWQRRRDQDLENYRDAPRFHVRQLQTLLGSCGGINGN